MSKNKFPKNYPYQLKIKNRPNLIIETASLCDLNKNYNGIFPCFFGGVLSVLFFVISRA